MEDAKLAPNLRAGEEEGGKTGNQNITETNLQLTCSLDGQFAHISFGGTTLGCHNGLATLPRKKNHQIVRSVRRPKSSL